jgi:NitT/TauT family transport system ATP-binding protein
VYEAPQHRADIYQLAADLKVRLDALPPLTEAAELLGFATVAQGDLTLTPLGETFADAGILARREIFASRIRRVPIFRWLLGLLTAADSHQLSTEVVTAALELDFPVEEAGRQVEIAINRDRYAELLSYDDNTRTLSLEGGVAPEPAPST